jgi:hypothetical protein
MEKLFPVQPILLRKFRKINMRRNIGVQFLLFFLQVFRYIAQVD